MAYLLNIIIFTPLIAAFINGMLVERSNKLFAKFISSACMFAVLLCSIIIFIEVGINKHVVHYIIYKWVHIDSLKINWSIYADQLTAIMFVLVSSVSFVVHIYSFGYMDNDKNLPKFLSYLSLFTFFMLALVSADNFLQLFFGWEGVGLCSYLLIGYYNHKESANRAAVKAFIVNRVGDFAFIVAIVTILFWVGSLDFHEVFAHSEKLSKEIIVFYAYEFSILDIICFMLFLGCMGKSAQIGMHVWLPDAMEGPTPVSALIHAATMVTAGVFLIVRCSFMFEYSPIVLQFITYVGAITCLFAALIAVAQQDIKKIIAYSTCSQLGYMFFACGVSAYGAAMFHLVTHGFFKALLFLSAGSVIHACHEQNIFKMGGLIKKMPLTYANFWAGSLAIIGVFPFAGFYSKDLILESAHAAEGAGQMAFDFGILAAFLTALYSVKIIILTFHGKTKLSDEVFEKVHESSALMNYPMLLLLAGTLFSGMFGFYILEISSPYGFFMNAIFNLNTDHAHHPSIFIQALPMLVGLAGMVFGILIYTTKLNSVFASIFKPIYFIISNKFFVDEVYYYLFQIPLRFISKFCADFDKKIVDFCGPGLAIWLISLKSSIISRIHTGYIFNYAFYIMFTLVAVITYFVASFIQIIKGF